MNQIAQSLDHCDSHLCNNLTLAAVSFGDGILKGLEHGFDLFERLSEMPLRQRPKSYFSRARK